MVDEPEALDDVIFRKARSEAGYAVAYALMEVARSQNQVADQIKARGNGDSFSREGFGAIELFGMKLTDQLDRIATSMAQSLDKDTD